MKEFHSLSEIKSEVHSGQLSVFELTQHYIQQVKEKNGRLNAFLSFYEQEALDRARSIDSKIESGTAGKLAGMVIGIKDVFAYRDHRLQCSSKILDGFESQFTATCVQRLINEDAVILGHQNCDEFAMGSSNENSAFGVCRNPVDESRVPGGSSGGSACATAAGMCLASIGSDTGGSVRQPAAFCGLVGLKPTYGRISRYGLAAYSSSFDTVGIMAKSVEDAALLLETMSGPDDFDSTLSEEADVCFSDFQLNKKYKIGYFGDALAHEKLDPQVKSLVESTYKKLEANGHTINETNFGLSEYLLPTYYVLTAAEASSNLSRYDGVRYGERADSNDLEAMYKKTRVEGFGMEVKRRIMTGTFVLSASYYDAYYTKAQKVRKLIQEETFKLFDEFDFIISPTTPSSAFKLNERADPIQMYLEDMYTVHANVAGVPAITIPLGTDEKGMPMGVQLMSKRFNELELLDISNQIITFQD